MSHTWSQRNVSWFVSTCGSTNAHEEKYLTIFEDDWANVNYEEINRPSICHHFHEWLTMIDEHNRGRQNILDLENMWKTKDCWFHLNTTITGMSTVYCHRWIRSHMRKLHIIESGRSACARNRRIYGVDPFEVFLTMINVK